MKPIKKIVIVGGGFAGWYTAASFQHNLPGIEIVIIDSQHVAPIGVGEVTGFDAPVHYRKLLGCEEPTDVFRHTGAIHKFGTEEVNLYRDGQSIYTTKFPNLKVSSLKKYFQPFDEPDFYEPWSREPGDVGVILAWSIINQGLGKNFQEYTSEVSDMVHFIKNNVAPVVDGKLALPQKNSYGFQTDSEQTIQFLKDLVYTRDYSRFNHFCSSIVEVRTNQDTVESLLLEDGRVVTGDLFIDASGMHRVLMRTGINDSWKAVGDEYNNASWVMPTAYTDPTKEIRGSNTFFGEKHGWRFLIRLYHRMGNGYIFNSKFVDPDEVRKDFIASAGATRFVEPKLITWNPGHYTKPWQGNVIPMGISAWFIDPLDSPTYDMHSKAIEDVIAIIKNWDKEPEPREKYNHFRSISAEERRTRLDITFGMSHTTGPFWDRARANAVKVDALSKIRDLILEKRSDIESRLNWYWNHIYIRIAIASGIDMQDWKFPELTNEDRAMAQAYYDFTRARNQYISAQAWPNYYEWIKTAIFDGETSAEALARLNPRFAQ